MRQSGIIDLGGQEEQRIADDQTGMITGRMGKLWPASDIANGKNLFIAGAHPRIGHNMRLAIGAECHAGFFQIQPGHIGRAACRHQKRIADNLACRRCDGDFRPRFGAFGRYGFHCAAFDKLHPIGQQLRPHMRR